MAIAIDTDSNAPASATSLSWSHTCTGSDLILVGLFWSSENNDGSIPQYNSVNMTLLDSQTVGPTQKLYMYYMINPPTGAHNVTWTGGVFLYAGVISFTGVHQVSPFNTQVKGTGTESPATVTATSAADEMVVDAMYTNSSSTITSDQTEAWQLTESGNKWGQSTKAGASPNVTMSWTLNGVPNYWAHIAVSLKPAGATTTAAGAYSMTFARPRLRAW